MNTPIAYLIKPVAKRARYTAKIKPAPIALLSPTQERAAQLFGKLNEETQATLLRMLEELVNKSACKARPTLRLVAGGTK